MLHCTLKELYISRADATDEGAIAVAQSLRENTALQVLSMTGNDLGGKTCTAFALMLEVNKTLLRLFLGSALSEPGHSKPFILALGKNRTLEKICVSTRLKCSSVTLRGW